MPEEDAPELPNQPFIADSLYRSSYFSPIKSGQNGKRAEHVGGNFSFFQQAPSSLIELHPRDVHVVCPGMFARQDAVGIESIQKETRVSAR